MGRSHCHTRHCPIYPNNKVYDANQTPLFANACHNSRLITFHICQPSPQLVSGPIYGFPIRQWGSRIIRILQNGLACLSKRQQPSRPIPSILVLIFLVNLRPAVAAPFLIGYDLHTSGLTNYFLSANRSSCGLFHIRLRFLIRPGCMSDAAFGRRPLAFYDKNKSNQ